MELKMKSGSDISMKSDADAFSTWSEKVLKDKHSPRDFLEVSGIFHNFVVR